MVVRFQRILLARIVAETTKASYDDILIAEVFNPQGCGPIFCLVAHSRMDELVGGGLRIVTVGKVKVVFTFNIQPPVIPFAKLEAPTQGELLARCLRLVTTR